VVVLGGLVLFVVGVVGLVVWLGQRSLIYYPDRSDPGPVAARVPGAQDVTLTTADGLQLSAWLITPAHDSRNVAVLFLPGNGGNRLGRLGLAQAISAQGFTVLQLDYRGYGGNPGDPTEDGLNLDAQAGVSYLESHGFPLSRVLYVGESIGTGVAVRLAASEEPAGVLLRSPYTSLADVASAQVPWLPVRWLLRDRFELMTYLPRVTAPITVLYGTADSIIPPSQSAAVAAAAPSLAHLEVVDGADHNDDIWAGTYVAQQISDLADAAGL